MSEKKPLEMIWQPKSVSVDKLNDILRALTKNNKENGSQPIADFARQCSQSFDVSAAKADDAADLGERVANANRKVTLEKCRHAFDRLRETNPAWSYTRLAKSAAKELGISLKTFRKYVKHPRHR